MNPRVEKVECIGNSKLEITFENDKVKIFDVASYFVYPVYRRLQDEAFFKKAQVLNGTVVWDEFIDFDPDILYLEGVELIRN
jgi:hypothetical protein